MNTSKTHSTITNSFDLNALESAAQKITALEEKVVNLQKIKRELVEAQASRKEPSANSDTITTTNTMKPYYYVYRWNDKGPKVRHATLESAQAEAMRLAEQHPTGHFEILKCVGFARTTKAATFWMDGEEPPKSGNPFRHVKPPEFY